MYKIISDHRGFIIISKFPGVSFHKENNDEGLLERIRSDLGIHGTYPVHRLDRMTSGLLLIAKHKDIARELSYAFRNRLVEKYYLAISDRNPRKKQGTIRGDMAKSRRGSWKLTRGNKNPAITSFFSYALGSGLRLYLVRPYTGKTHQIRVALKSLGAPVLGDTIYHKKEKNKEYERGYLHSYALRFTVNGRQYRFEQIPETGRHFTETSFLLNVKKCEHPWDQVWPVTG